LESITLETDSDPFKDFRGGKSREEMQALIRTQMGGKGYMKMNQRGSIHLIAGENLDIGELCGTNCFAIGTGSKRYLIDVCKKNHDTFLNNVQQFMEE